VQPVDHTERKVLIIQRRKTRVVERLDLLIDHLNEERISSTIVFLEDISVIEALRLFYHHKIVIGVHGNGLSHLFCMRYPALVVILVPHIQESRDRKEVPGYNTNNVNEKYAMGYGTLANSFGISSLVIESERDELQRNHWQMHNARLNKTLASVITSACEKFFRDITDIHTIKPKHG